MSTDWYGRVRSVYLAVRERPAAEREQAIREACGSDPALQHEVESLLAHDTGPSRFLESPALGSDFAVKGPTDLGSPGDEGSGISPARLSMPERIGRYLIRRLIGEGGMGSVFEAEQTEPIRRTVAIKLIRIGTRSRELSTRFAIERQALAMLNHAGVARVFDAGETDDGQPYFVMEYVAGAPITRFCDEQKHSARQRLSLFLQLCDIVQYAHQKGVIHRDLKPSNILVSTSDGATRLVVIDFGLAKLMAPELSPGSMHTEVGRILGTPEYMSPEQADNAAEGIDTRADVYSLGAVLYELLAGAPPFDPKRMRSVGFAEMQRILREEEPPRPSATTSSLGQVARGELDWIVAKAMCKDRSQRYSTVAALAEDVRRYISGDAVQAGPPSVMYRVRKLITRHRGAFAATGVAFTSLLIGLVAAVSGYVAAIHANEAKSKALSAAMDSANEARRETNRAQAMSDFFAGVLTSGSPKYPGGKLGRTVAEALVDAGRRLDAGEFCDDPPILLILRLTLGRGLSGLGYLDDALPHAVQSVELARAAYPDGHPDLAKALELRGIIAMERDDYDTGEALLHDAYRMMLATNGPSDDQSVYFGVEWSQALMLLGRYDDCVKLLREMLTQLRPEAEARPAAYVSVAISLARVLSVQSHYDIAAATLREVQPLLDSAQVADSPRPIEFWSELGDALRNLGDLEAALHAAQRSLRLTRERYGDRGAPVSAQLSRVAATYESIGNLDQAEATYREAIALTRELFGEENHNYAVCLCDISTVLVAKNAREEAERNLQTGLAILRRVHGRLRADDAISIIALTRLLLTDRSRVDEVLPLLREALALRQAGFPEDSIYVIEAKYFLTRALGIRAREDQSVFPECEQMMLSAWESLQRMDDARFASWKNSVAQVLYSMYELWDSVEPADEKKANAVQWRRRYEEVAGKPAP